MNIKINKENEIKIIELIKFNRIPNVAKIFNCSDATIINVLKRNNIKIKKSRINMSKLALNIDYFKEINLPDKAYWLGYICADGCINKTGCKVSLVSKDIDVIENFKEAIGAEHTIRKNEIFDKRTNKTYTGYSIQIGNELFVNNIINLGITSKKSSILDFPNIEEKYYSYFIAGLFDGDGTLNWAGKNKNHLKISLISTKEILNYIIDYLQTKYNIQPKYMCSVTKNKENVWKLHLYSDAHRFLEFIYKDKNFKYYLKRKYDIYLQNIENRKNTRHIRKILQYDENMNLINIWNNMKKVCIDTHCSHTTLKKYIKEKKLLNNYYWIYENNIS